MSTKFVSKNSNLMVVLKPGVPGSVITGQQPQAGIYVRFQGGVVDIHEESIINMLKNHRSFGTDFVEIKQTEVDPFENTRKEIEPAHHMIEMEFGHIGKSTKSAQKAALSPELRKMIEAEAVKILPTLLKKNPKILKDILANLAAEAGIVAKEAKDESVKEASQLEKNKEEIIDKKE